MGVGQTTFSAPIDTGTPAMGASCTFDIDPTLSFVTVADASNQGFWQFPIAGGSPVAITVAEGPLVELLWGMCALIER